MTPLPESGPRTFAVRVSHRVERTVYVEASSAAEAKRAARYVNGWVDADPIDEDRAADGVRPLRAEPVR